MANDNVTVKRTIILHMTDGSVVGTVLAHGATIARKIIVMALVTGWEALHFRRTMIDAIMACQTVVHQIIEVNWEQMGCINTNSGYGSQTPPLATLPPHQLFR